MLITIITFLLLGSLTFNLWSGFLPDLKKPRTEYELLTVIQEKYPNYQITGLRNIQANPTYGNCGEVYFPCKEKRTGYFYTGSYEMLNNYYGQNFTFSEDDNGKIDFYNR